MSVVVRFAPSPTGLLHVGNARMALINWLCARHGGGKFILRFDDTDLERSKPEYADAIEADLKWLGLDWDGVEHQSQRLAPYDKAFEALKSQDRVYACYETGEELDYMRKRLRAQGKPPIYTPPSDAKLAEYVAEGRTAHWRFKLAEGEIDFDDEVRGHVHFETRHLSDPVIRREDETWLYMLPSAVDDADMGVTHVVRGEDHVANTALQLQMFEAMGAPVPTFAHLPLLTDMEGGGLSKRIGSLSLKELREDGIEPLALASYLAHLGTSDDIELASSQLALADGFEFSHFGRGTPKFDPKQLARLNGEILHKMAYGEAETLLSALGIGPLNEAMWLAVRENLERLVDVKDWMNVCHGDIASVIDAEDADFIKAARDVLPEGDFDADTWGQWTKAVKEATGRKGKGLFMPLRLALTGLDHGPELKALLPIIGREKALKRLTKD